jgi:RTX calcium-binding nonapeptide repeat (4 copies)
MGLTTRVQAEGRVARRATSGEYMHEHPLRLGLPTSRTRAHRRAVTQGLLGLAMLAGSSKASAQAFECPSFGDTCDVKPGEMRMNFPGIGAGNDTVVLGRLNFLFYNTIVACVNGQVQFASDVFGLVRDRLDQDTVLCTDGGNDNIRVLSGRDTFNCNFTLLPVQLTALNYNGKELKIFAGSGTDVIRGGDGVDRICGGTGNDRLYGGFNRNELNGGEGNDYIEASIDIDWMFGADGDDIIVDVATGGYRGDCAIIDPLRTPSRMEGGAGNDCLEVPTQNEPGWCYRQGEQCGGTGQPICTGGLWCGAGPSDRINTDTNFGVGCEVRTSGQPCPRF